MLFTFPVELCLIVENKHLKLFINELLFRMFYIYQILEYSDNFMRA